MNGVGNTRRPEWTESLAVGSEEFAREIHERLGICERGRKVAQGAGHYALEKPAGAYDIVLTPENALLKTQNGFFWRESPYD